MGREVTGREVTGRAVTDRAVTDREVTAKMESIIKADSKHEYLFSYDYAQFEYRCREGLYEDDLRKLAYKCGYNKGKGIEDTDECEQLNSLYQDEYINGLMCGIGERENK